VGIFATAGVFATLNFVVYIVINILWVIQCELLTVRRHDIHSRCSNDSSTRSKMPPPTRLQEMDSQHITAAVRPMSN